MISLRTIHTLFPPNCNVFAFHNHNRAPSYSYSKKNGFSFICPCKSDDPSQPEGDTQKQEMLAQIAMLQTQKVRLTDYLDDTAASLTKFAEDANAEFDKVGEDALKDLDDASNRIMENIESRMQAFEESAELKRLEIEKNEGELSEFEGQIEVGRNQGMFFQSLGQKAPADKAKAKEEAKEEAKKIQQVTKESASSSTRRNIYLGLIGILALSIADAFISSSPDWKKVALLGAILIGLFTQLGYEQGVSSEAKRTENSSNSTEEEEK